MRNAYTIDVLPVSKALPGILSRLKCSSPCARLAQLRARLPTLKSQRPHDLHGNTVQTMPGWANGDADMTENVLTRSYSTMVLDGIGLAKRRNAMIAV